jgi:hypothetical protein
MVTLRTDILEGDGKDATSYASPMLSSRFFFLAMGFVLLICFCFFVVLGGLLCDAGCTLVHTFRSFLPRAI